MPGDTARHLSACCITFLVEIRCHQPLVQLQRMAGGVEDGAAVDDAQRAVHPEPQALEHRGSEVPGYWMGHIRTAALSLAPVAPQGCVALRAPVLHTPLSRAGFAVVHVLPGVIEQKANIVRHSPLPGNRSGAESDESTRRGNPTTEDQCELCGGAGTAAAGLAARRRGAHA